jgi:hypothetical protein
LSHAHRKCLKVKEREDGRETVIRLTCEINEGERGKKKNGGKFMAMKFYLALHGIIMNSETVLHNVDHSGLAPLCFVSSREYFRNPYCEELFIANPKCDNLAENSV